MPDYNNRIANWIYYNGSAIADQATNQSKDTIILYYYSMILSHDGSVVYIFEQVFDCQKGHISSIHTSITIFEFGNEFDKMPILRHFHNFPHHQKTPLFHQKSSQRIEKIRLLSNSTENTIYNKEITLQNQLIYNSKITQNTSKINTSTLQHKSKFHSSIEV